MLHPALVVLLASASTASSQERQCLLLAQVRIKEQPGAPGADNAPPILSAGTDYHMQGRRFAAAIPAGNLQIER